MIYFDGIHLIGSDSLELHKFAKKCGDPKSAFHDSRYPHYDLFEQPAKHAVEYGAIIVSTKTILRMLKSGDLNV